LVARTTRDWFEGTALYKFTPAYHWACALDDYDQNVEWIVRCIDLKEALPLQQQLQLRFAEIDRKLNWIPPSVFHTALVVNADGSRLEKRSKGVTLRELSERGKGTQEILQGFKRSAQALRCTESRGMMVDEEPAQLSVEALL
jgi:glutamyl/glutaminyl-tRNA synthetase